MGAALASVFVLVGAALVASCKKPYDEETERYVFVATNINLPYWQDAQAGFMGAAKTLGVKGELTGPTTYDPSGEVGMFRRIVEQQPAGICVFAARPDIFQAEIDKAVAQGIPVICVDADVPNSKRVMYTGCGGKFCEAVKWLGIREVLTAPQSPWQNPYVERLIGSIRRECLDHVIVFNGAGLRRVLRDYFEYYEHCRTHLFLDKDAYASRPIEPPARSFC